jgi:hypothetical protein
MTGRHVVLLSTSLLSNAAASMNPAAWGHSVSEALKRPEKVVFLRPATQTSSRRKVDKNSQEVGTAERAFSGDHQRNEENGSQSAEGRMIMQTGAIGEPRRLPLRRIQRLVLDE